MEEHHIEIRRLTAAESMELSADNLALGRWPRVRVMRWRPLRVRVTFRANSVTNPRVVGGMSVMGRPRAVFRVYRTLTRGTGKLPDRET